MPYERIISIKEIGELETMDIEVDNQSHTFYANGISTSNSHSLEYAVNGYITAYAKAHFPVEFFTSWLAHAKFKQKPKEEMANLINEAKLFDIEVKGPNLNLLNKYFDTDGKTIFFGLSDVKSLGESRFIKINSLLKDYKIKDWYSFVVNFGQEVQCVEELVSTGGIKFDGLSRTEQLEHVRIIKELSDKEILWCKENYANYKNITDLLFGMAKPKKEGGGCANKNRIEKVLSMANLLKNPPSPFKDEISWIASTEERLLGIAISCSKIDDKDIDNVNCSCKEFINGAMLEDYILAGTITDVRIIKVKNGKNAGSEMCYIGIDDGSACMQDIVAFSEKYEQLKDLLIKDNTIIIVGRRDKKRSGVLILDNALSI